KAQFGGVFGGVVNVVTKTSTNEVHGEAWEFFRNSSFDARNPITGINLLHQNQFGANIGGPALLPHYNGRNRTFFFGSYEGVRFHVGNANQSLIPTAAQSSGDFTGGNQLYNPYSTTSSGTRTPFLCQGTTNTPVPLMAGTKLQAPLGTTAAPAGQSACNILPPQLMDPNMQAVAQLLYGSLTPNLTGVAGKNFHETLTNNQDPDSYNIRIDEQVGQKNAFWGRLSHIGSPRDVPESTPKGVFLTNLLVDPKNAFWGRFSHISSPRDVPGIFGQINLNT